ncbi:MAG: biopolymer transporter ExbD [Rhodospirillales bacterium]|nr:biopolymer transporter ExbD [Rhodospirillales bacterium]
MFTVTPGAAPDASGRIENMRRRAIISMTPLIDVVFILLVFFMLASSFMDWRTLELGVAKAGGTGKMAGAMLVELRGDDLRLSGRTMSEDDVLQTLRQRFLADPAQKVLIKPAPGVPLQRAVALIDRIAAAGGKEVSFVASPEGR